MFLLVYMFLQKAPPPQKKQKQKKNNLNTKCKNISFLLASKTEVNAKNFFHNFIIREASRPYGHYALQRLCIILLIDL